MATTYHSSTPKTTFRNHGAAPDNAPSAGQTVSASSQQHGRLFDRFRDKMRSAHYALSTEKSYRYWILEYLRFHRRNGQWRHPAEMGKSEIEAFLTDLAVQGKVAANTQNQAFCALLFLYKQVLEIELPLIQSLRARESRRLPVVLSRDEVAKLISQVAGSGGTYRLMVELLYGAGLRLLECCRLRVKDIDFRRHQLLVREGKGDKDRAVPLPDRCIGGLRAQIARVASQHEFDCERGYGRADLPYALRRKYPGAERELAWQYVFFSDKLSHDPRDPQGPWYRHHIHESVL